MMAAAGRSLADDLSLTAEPSFSHIETDLTDQAGVKTRQVSDGLRQRYGLSLDRRLTEYIAASAGGSLVDDRGWRRSNDVWSETHAQSTTVFGRLSLGTPVLTAGLGVDRRVQNVLSSPAPAFVTESFTADASWRPLDLPELQLRLSRVNAFDRARSDRDVTTDSAQLSTRYKAQQSDVRFLVGWSRSVDHLHLFETSAIEQTALASRADEIFGGRTTTYVSGSVQSRTTSTSARGAGGTITRPQLPIAGLSAIVTPPSTPETVPDSALASNPALIDGNVAVNGGINVGFSSAAPLGDDNPREVGARFADAVTDVNTIHVWLLPGDPNRALTPEVGGALAALTGPRALRVYARNAANQPWNPVTVTAATPSPVENRIEITIAQTRARFLKVTLTPLAATVTTDTAFRDIFVTEVQFQLVLPIDQVPRTASTVLVSVAAIARTKILREPELDHDISLNLSRRTAPSLTSYTIVNGLSARRTLWADIVATARAARQDVTEGSEHEGTWQWTAGLAGHPLPAAFWSLTYSGTATDRDETSHNVTALARADLYEGISAQASGGGSIVTQDLRTARSGQASGTVSLSPNAYVTVTAGGLYSRSLASDPDVGDTLTQFGRVDGSVSITPAPALSGTGTISRVLIGARPTTLATVQANYSPLRGDLQLGVAYSKTLDTEAEATTELLSPSLRWNIRSGVSLTASYTYVENASPAQTLASRALAARLLIVL